ncbi:MAG: NifB/NifX family molybdenum-iron cluster-binding protein [Bacteroidales bacterium]|nr:NifB/NifX family molybdenum-iron cluster-binding protein [Bacteroidales bacterium]
MKTVITSKGNNQNASFDLRFGRAGWFCVVDDASGKPSFIENEQADATGGAGVKAAEKMVELGVQKVISGDFGPKAKELLEKFNIQMVIIQGENQSIKEIISQLIN